MIAASQVTVVGTGLLGASLALGLRQAGYDRPILGVGRRRSTLRRTARLDCFDHCLLLEDLEQAVADRSLLVLCAPLGRFNDLLDRLAVVHRPGVIVTDVGSVKGEVCRQAARRLDHPDWFVGSHPMAGSERHGPEAASAELFTGKPCIVTPGRRCAPAARRTVRALWRTLRMRLMEMSPAEHDRRAAMISHLPHAVAATLVRLGQRAGGLPLASTGFRDTTRVAGGDPDVWMDILRDNRDSIVRALDRMLRELGSLRCELADGGRGDAKVRARLGDARAVREAWLRSFERHCAVSGNQDHEP